MTGMVQEDISIRTWNEYPISAYLYPRLGTPTVGLQSTI